MFQANVVLGGGGSKAEEGTKLYISNLDYTVSNEDLEVLTCRFSSQVIVHCISKACVTFLLRF